MCGSYVSPASPLPLLPLKPSLLNLVSTVDKWWFLDSMYSLFKIHYFIVGLSDVPSTIVTLVGPKSIPFLHSPYKTFSKPSPILNSYLVLGVLVSPFPIPFPSPLSQSSPNF